MDKKEKIVSAFFNLAMKEPTKKEFTMTEIAKEAGMSRQAIYAKHFYNVEDIINYIHKSIDDEIFKMAEAYNPMVEPDPFVYIADALLPMIYQNKERIRCLYYSNMDPFWLNFLFETYNPLIERFLTKQTKLKYGNDTFNVSDFLLKAIVAMIETWMGNEEPLPPEEFKPIFLKMTSLSVKEYLDMD